MIKLKEFFNEKIVIISLFINIFLFIIFFLNSFVDYSGYFNFLFYLFSPIVVIGMKIISLIFKNISENVFFVFLWLVLILNFLYVLFMSGLIVKVYDYFFNKEKVAKIKLEKKQKDDVIIKIILYILTAICIFFMFFATYYAFKDGKGNSFYPSDYMIFGMYNFIFANIFFLFITTQVKNFSRLFTRIIILSLFIMSNIFLLKFASNINYFIFISNIILAFYLVLYQFINYKNERFYEKIH